VGVRLNVNVTLIMHGALILAIFILLFISCSQLLELGIQSMARRSRLRGTRSWPKPRIQLLRYRKLIRASPVVLRHLDDLLESLSLKMRAPAFVWMSMIGSLIGIAAGAYVFQSVKGIACLAIMMAVLPYTWLRMRLVTRQMRSRLEFLPAVEVFYQYYLMADTHNIRQVLAACLEERRMRMPVRASFELLLRHLSTHRLVEDSLRIFAFSLGHVWGRYMTNMLRVGLTEGADISASLHDLITDMRQAQAADQAARNRLLEIRIASFSPPIFLVLFIMVNLRLNEAQAIYYYLVDPAGRNMLLNGIVLMFMSLVMGLWLSIRRM